MTDPFQDIPEFTDSRATSHREITITGSLLLLILLTLILPGCNDSHSDEFREFNQTEFSTGDTESPADDSVETASADTDAAPVDDTSASPVTEDEVTTPVEPEPESPEPPTEPVPADDEFPPAGSEEETEEQPKASSAQPIKLLIPHRNFRKEGTALRASFDDIDLLKILNMDPVPMDAADHFPKWLNDLNGQRVRIRGYMRPGFELEGITEFLFVRDNGECCYGPLPKIYDMIAVQLAEGESSDLIEGTPFDVEGTFRIEPHSDEIELYGLFFIDDGVIIE